MTHRHWFYITTFLMLGTFAYAMKIDHIREWKPYQQAYYDRMVDESKKAGKTADVEDWKSRPIQIKQIIARDLGRVDRCVTCHVGMDEFTNPSLTNDFKDNPFK